MPSETAAARRKRLSSDTNPAPEGDHRKRRRNRTTQSCLNCHTSKRMCDRKRPACARCTQLGLTGLCVYEVDDPNQRSDSQDESARLLKRVAELEGVIRELKNKPHPRWVQATNVTGPEPEKWTPRTHLRTRSEGGQPSSNSPSPPSSMSDTSDVSSPSGRSTRSLSISNSYPPPILDSVDVRPSQTTVSSPQSTPSPGLVTPTDEFARSHISLSSQTETPQAYDLASMFLPYPGLLECDPTSFGTLGKCAVPGDPYYQKGNISHCGCLHETTSYNVLLELSLRLRKAADVLARSASHQMGQHCSLHQRISELDIMTTNALGNVSITPDDLQTSIVSPHSDRSQSSASNSLPLHSPAPFRNPSRATVSSDSFQSMRSWDLLSVVAGSTTSCEDGFMTWDPSRRS